MSSGIARRLEQITQHDRLESSIGGGTGLDGSQPDFFTSLSPAEFQNRMRGGISRGEPLLFQASGPRRFSNDLTTAGAGGFLIGRDLVEAYQLALGDTSPMRRTSTVLTRAKGMNRVVPLIDDQAIESGIIPIDGANTKADLPIAAKTLEAWTFAAPQLRISRFLLEDAPQLAAGVFAILAQRMARGQNRAFTTGIGDGDSPAGIVTSAPVAVTTASATAIAFDDVLALVASVASPYRERASFMANANIQLALWQLKDGIGQYLWRASGLDKYPFVLNAHMPSGITAGSTPLLFGDLSAYSILDVGPTKVKVLTEAYAEFNEIAFESWQDSDGTLADPSGAAVVALKMHS